MIEHQTRVSMTEGAFVGGPFLVLIPIAFCAALLAQAQMALELAALAGYAPDDEMRAADLLVIQRAYDSTAEASEALAKLTRDPKSRQGKRLPRGTRIAMVKRMAYMLGLLGSSDQKPSRLRSILQMALVGVVFLVRLGASPRLGPVHGARLPQERRPHGRPRRRVLRAAHER